MLSYQVYKIVHVVSIVLFFSMFAKAAYAAKSEKMDKISTGIFLVLILIGGFGLMARLGIGKGGGWPVWIYLKLAIWTIVGAVGHISLKRFPQHSVKVFWGSVGLLTVASYLANYKPF
ncbi:MAG: hypothetical protein CME65_03825 [Halobacteriovoraceae bacterium]|nr:hypothetical protein [Halobacteriovoraceae bacterium]|tara:strand:- start:7697 stop:8050 length:354 start_codon:yes stop_codon:yes gene_type:complete